MSSGDNELKNKVSTHINAQLPEFIQADHPLFSQFVKVYYQFLESAELTFSETNNYVRQETQSVNFLLDENEDQIVLEDSESKFTVGEILTGQTSGATLTPSSDTETVTLANSNTLTLTTGYANPELQPDSGNIIYLENRKPIQRDSDQTEDIKVVVEF